MPALRHQYTAGIVAAALVLALAVAAILQGARGYRDDSEWVTHTLRVMSEMDHAHAGLLRGIAAQRTYLLTGDPAFREMFEASRRTVRSDLARLAAMVDGNPGQVRRVEALGALAEHRMDLAHESIRLFDAQGLAAAQDGIRRNHGRAVAAELDALVDAFHEEERVMLRTRAAQADWHARILVAAAVAAIPLALGILLFLFMRLSREARHRAAAERRAKSLNEELQATVGALERTGAGLSLLARYTGLLQSCRSVDEALEVTRRVLEELLPGTAGTIYLQRASQDHVEARAGWGRHAADSPPLVEPQACWALRRAQPHATDDVVRDMRCPHVSPPAEGTACTACIPLEAQALNLGLLYLSAPGPGPIPGLSVAQAAAEQLSLALGNLQLQETLRQQSIRDALTGLYNRRYLEASLPREIARCERRNGALAVIMLDLDHFKTFNDAHGHDAGDSVLSAFGRLLIEHARGEDIPCRYGGEEFTLILADADLATARPRAEALRAAVAGLSVRHAGRVLPRVTLSAGVAAYPAHGTTAEDLLKAADDALYAAKRGGRDRVAVADAA